MRRSHAFTLIEVVLVIFILALMLLVAVPSLTGVLSDRRLRRSLDNFNQLVSQAHEHSVAEHRPYLIVIGEKSVDLHPEIVSKDDDSDFISGFPLESKGAMKLKLPAALTKKTLDEWIFWPSGTCEPAVIEFVGRDGAWTAKYSPLTTRPELTRYAPR